MKKVVLLTFLVIGASFAWAQKVGHVNALEVIGKVPAKKEADKKIEELTKTYMNDIETKTKALETKFKDLQTKAQGASKEQLQSWEKELQSEQQEIEKLRREAVTKMEEKREALYSPVLESVQKAINEVAAEKGLNYIIDASPDKGVLLYDVGGNDITSAVKTKLGIKE